MLLKIQFSGTLNNITIQTISQWQTQKERNHNATFVRILNISKTLF